MDEKKQKEIRDAALKLGGRWIREAGEERTSKSVLLTAAATTAAYLAVCYDLDRITFMEFMETMYDGYADSMDEAERAVIGRLSKLGVKNTGLN